MAGSTKFASPFNTKYGPYMPDTRIDGQSVAASGLQGVCYFYLLACAKKNKLKHVRASLLPDTDVLNLLKLACLNFAVYIM